MDNAPAHSAPNQLLAGEASKQKFLAAFVAYVGGADVLRWMQKHYGEGYRYYQLAEWDGEKPSTIRYRVRRAGKIMKEHGLFPSRWVREDELQRQTKARGPANRPTTTRARGAWSPVSARNS